MNAQLIKINAIMLVLFIEVISVNIIGNFTTGNTTKHSTKQNTADNILGDWVSDDNERTIKITKNGSVYEGVLTAGPKAEFIGKKILTGMVYSDNKYTGKIYLPKRDAFYDCTAKLKTNDNLIVEGSMGFISKEIKWTRKK
jgi:uncharacterized protein (DUF2147 family)